jgi:hypothetical protein
MPIKFLPGHFVYWHNVENHNDIKKEIMEWVKMNEESGVEQQLYDLKYATTTYSLDTSSLKDNKFLLQNKFLEPIVWKGINNIIKFINNSDKFAYKLNFEDHYLTNAWYTKYNEHGSLDLHSHESVPIYIKGGLYHSTFSVIYILHDENDKNTTTFNLVGQTSPLQPTSEFVLDTGDYDNIKEGTALIFPDSLYHRVMPNKKPGRITLAFNVCSKYS